MKTKKTLPPAPRKLALLVAAALAVEPFCFRPAAAVELMSATPITFERNLGQFEPDVLYITRGIRGDIAIRAGEVSVAPANRPAMRLALAGANPRPEVEALEPKRTRSNYYHGASGAPITAVPHFGRVVIKGVYPQVDLAFHGQQNALEYDFHLAPGADPAVIRLDLSTAQESWIDGDGNLRLRIAGGELTQRAPVAYQVVNGQRVDVDARFELRETERGREAGFVTAAYDRSQPLVIDPVLSFSTYLGASGADAGGLMRADAQGNLHVASANAAAGASVLTVTKIDHVTREVMFSTSVGGISQGSLRAMAVGGSGAEAMTYVTGTTTAAGFPVCVTCPTHAGATDAFVMRLDADGQVVNSRLVGGANADEVTGMALDVAGNVYLAGHTSSFNFPITTGAPIGGTDAFVTRLSPNLETLQFSSLIGGSGDETVQAITVDASGNIYLAMKSTSDHFPTPTAANGRSFVAKFDSNAELQWNRYLGASGGDFTALSLDSVQRPVVGGFQYKEEGQRAFVSRLSVSSGSTLQTVVLEGEGDQTVRDVADVGGNLYMVGSNHGTFTAVAVPPPGIGASGATDAFIVRVGASGMDFATVIGGTGNDFANSMAVTPAGDVYVAGTTESANFPTVDPLRGARAGPSDIFVAEIARQFHMHRTSMTLREDQDNVSFRISRSGSLAASATVRWTAVNGTALAGTHFGTAGVTTAPTGIITFPAGIGTVDFYVGELNCCEPEVNLIDDGITEAPKTFTIELSEPSAGFSLGPNSVNTITIIGDEDSLGILDPSVTVVESAGVANITVARQGNSFEVFSVQYTTANGSALAGQHYTARSGTLTWDGGDNTTRTVSVPIIDNAGVNPNRTFSVNFFNPVNATFPAPTTATVTIVDDDDTIALSTTSSTVGEDDGSVTLRVRRTGSLAGPASVVWSTTNGTAVSGTDFGTEGAPVPLGGLLEWESGDATEKELVIPVLGNTHPQPNRTFNVTLTNVAGAKLGTASTVVTIADNDPGFALSATSYTVNENGGNVVVQVNRGGSSTGPASVKWTTGNGTAIAGQDFGTANNAAQRSGTLSWLAGDTAPKTITIPILQDTVGEGMENFIVSLNTPSTGMTLGSPSIAPVFINDDDLATQSEISFSEPKYVVLENSVNAVLTVHRTPVGTGFTVPATVNYATQPGTALATSDYTTRSGTLSWAALDGASKLITIPLVNNTLAEPNETFRVTLSSTSPGVRILTPQASVVIIDDDEKFPPFGAVPDGWEVPVGATAGWHASSDPGAYEGAFTLRSDAIEDNETAQVEVTRTFAAGNITFRVKISSEANFDRLRFFVDDVQRGVWSGTAIPGWQAFTTPITAGTHTVRWSYEKDDSASVGQDAAFIDSVVLP